MQPSLLFDQGGGAIPYSERLAPGQDVRISSITAKWNGAAAAGTFLACLSLYSQSGVLLSRSFPSQQFAAGDSGVVTYAPPLGASGTSENAFIKRYWYACALQGSNMTIPTAAETLLATNDEVNFGTTDHEADFATAKISVKSPAAGRSFFLRYQAYWGDTPAEYRFISIHFAGVGTGSMQLTSWAPGNAAILPRNETARSRYQEIFTVVPFYASTAASAIEATFYAYQESGVDKTVSANIELFQGASDVGVPPNPYAP